MMNDRGGTGGPTDADTDTADPSTEDRTTVKSVGTTLDIIEHLHEHGEATMEEIVAAVGRSTSTVHRHLMTLRDRGYVVGGSGTYSLSLLFLTYGGRTRDRLFASDIIDRKVQQLSEHTGERVQFMIEEGGQRVYVFTYSGPSGVKTDAVVGKRGPLHVSAAGKAILANLPEDRIEEILADMSTEGLAENAIEDVDALREELAAVRERGYAYNDEESTKGLRAVGVPVRDGDGAVTGALSVSGPVHRFRDDYFHEELPDLLLGAANEVELNLKYA